MPNPDTEVREALIELLEETLKARPPASAARFHAEKLTDSILSYLAEHRPPSAKDALATLHKIVAGIDADEISSPDGWWETSTGAAFGAGKLAELESFVRALVSRPPSMGEEGRLHHHDHHPWCQPGDEPHRIWILRFADQDMREMIWTNEGAEQQAREAYAMYSPAWNCYLFAAESARPSLLPDREGVALRLNRLSHPDMCRLSTLFGRATDYRTDQDQRINEWLKAQIADAKGDL